MPLFQLLSCDTGNFDAAVWQCWILSTILCCTTWANQISISELELSYLSADKTFQHVNSIFHDLVDEFVPLKTNQGNQNSPWKKRPPTSLINHRCYAWQQIKMLASQFGRFSPNPSAAYATFPSLNNCCRRISVSCQAFFRKTLSCVLKIIPSFSIHTSKVRRLEGPQSVCSDFCLAWCSNLIPDSLQTTQENLLRYLLPHLPQSIPNPVQQSSPDKYSSWTWTWTWSWTWISNFTYQWFYWTVGDYEPNKQINNVFKSKLCLGDAIKFAKMWSNMRSYLTNQKS